MNVCKKCNKELTGKWQTTFCSRSCANSFNNEGKQSHNYKHGISAYRQDTLREYNYKCSVCGYDIIIVLEVHHKDGDRLNNKSSNLDCLCPTHHKEYQLGIRKYT